MGLLNTLSTVLPFAGTAISAVGNLFGQSSANNANVQAVRETNQANRELAQYNWEQQLAMWNRQNEYNAPSAQMSRLKDAGLNPHLVYGNGVTGNTSGQLPAPQLAHMEAPRVEALRYGDAFKGVEGSISSYVNAKRLENETKLAESQVAAQTVENSLKLMQKTHEFYKMRQTQQKLDYDRQLFPSQLKVAQQAVVQSEQNIRETSQHITNMLLEKQLLEKGIVKSEQELRNLEQTYRKMAAEMAESYSRVRLNDAQVRHLNATTWGQSLDNRFKFATFADRQDMIYQDLITNTIKGEDAVLQYIDHWNTGTSSNITKGALERALRGVHNRASAVSAHPSWANIPLRRRSW